MRPQFGGPEPGGAVLLEDQPLGRQQVDRLVHRPALLDGGLAVPLVEDDAHRFQGRPDEAENPVGRPPAGLGDVLRTVVGLSQVGDVFALVATFGDLVARRRASRLCPRVRICPPVSFT